MDQEEIRVTNCAGIKAIRGIKVEGRILK